MLGRSPDDGCVALLAFLRQWAPNEYVSLKHAAEMLDQNVVFRLDGDVNFIHDRPGARAAFLAEEFANADAPEGVCLVTGEFGPIARLHPSIKGVRGAKSSGAAIVSFNQDSFTSFNRGQGAVAPVSESAAYAYGTALNALMAPAGVNRKGHPAYPNRVMLGDITVPFWAEHGDAEGIARALMAGDVEGGFDDEPADDETTETAKVSDILNLMQDGFPLQEAAPDMDCASRVFVLGLSPNAARLSVRFWVDQSLGDLAGHFQQHWADMRLDPPPGGKPPGVWRLLVELAPQRKSKNIPPLLGGEVMRSILTGLPYPRSLLSQTIMRIRAEQDREDPETGRTLEKVSDLRIATIKACLARMRRWKLITEDVPVSLDLTTPNSAYRLGRLFATLERIQAAALGDRNATVRDRYYSSASATPALVFPSLIRNASNHSKAIRSQAKPGLAAWFDDQVGETLSAGFEASFPRTLSLEEQGRFAIGYYHQRDALRRKKDMPAETNGADTATNGD
jgi:CRISPR-associated protein Csd1